MSEDQKQMSFKDYYQIMRNQIILAYDGAKEIALRNFDDMAKKLEEKLIQEIRKNETSTQTN